MRITDLKSALALGLLAALFLLSACGGGGGAEGGGGGTTLAPLTPSSSGNSGADGSGDGTKKDPDPVEPDPVVTNPVVPDPIVPDPVVPDPVVPDPVVPTPLPPSTGGGVDGSSHGPRPLNLRNARNFAVVAETAITTILPSIINGNVGLSPASGANMGVGCPPVTGRLYTVDSANPRPCQLVDPDLLTLVVGDGHAAWHVARDERPADYTEVGGGNIGGMTLAPATYRWSTGVRIPTNLTLRGGPNDVWIFVIQRDLVVAPRVQIFLEGGASPQNIYWVTLVDNVEIGAEASFQGVVLAETSIDMKTGASINGRLLAAQGINLDGNTITQP